MAQILVKQGKNAGIEYPPLLEEAIGNINLDDWYKGNGFGYALATVPDDLAQLVFPDDFDIVVGSETYTETEITEDGERTVEKTREVKTATLNTSRFNARRQQEEQI